MSGRNRSRTVGFDVINTQPLRSFAHAAALQRRSVSASLGNSLKASATMFKEPRTPLRCGPPCGSIIAAISVPCTRRSISSAFASHAVNCSGVGFRFSK
jgi:hypothetical protein